MRNPGAQYVLLLDQGVPYDEGRWLIQTGEDYEMGWEGLANLADDTPGFETILADGDMRLYKITAEESAEDQQFPS